jgi:hypothetical protein
LKYARIDREVGFTIKLGAKFAEHADPGAALQIELQRSVGAPRDGPKKRLLVAKSFFGRLPELGKKKTSLSLAT